MGKQARLRATRRLHESAVIEAYEAVANAAYPAVFNPQCCLNGTRVCIDVLAHFGIRAVPMVVDVFIFNRAMVDLVEKHGRWPETKEERDAWMDQHGAWGLGMGGTGDGWPRHLIAVTDNHIIDSAAHQFHRPAKAINFPDYILAAPRPAKFIDGEDANLVAVNGAVLTYRADPVDRSFTTLPGYQHHADNVQLAHEIIAHIERRVC